MRTYKINLEKSRGGMSGEQIRQAKNARCKARAAASKAIRREEAESRNADWNCLSPLEQLRDLDRRLGYGKGAVKQRKRIAARLTPQ